MTVTRFMNGKEISEDDLKNITLRDEKILEIIDRVKERINGQTESEVA